MVSQGIIQLAVAPSGEGGGANLTYILEETIHVLCIV